MGAVPAEYLTPGTHPPGTRIPRQKDWISVCVDGIGAFDAHAGAVSLTYHVDKFFGELACVITVDASPWGLGGYIEHRWKLLGWFTDRIQDLDVHKFGIKIGSHISQTLLEALAVLVSVMEGLTRPRYECEATRSAPWVP